jgi:Tfp pilus assembly protein PilX
LLRDEQRIGSNLDDAQLAFRLAETALQAGRQPCQACRSWQGWVQCTRWNCAGRLLPLP